MFTVVMMNNNNIMNSDIIDCMFLGLKEEKVYVLWLMLLRVNAKVLGYMWKNHQSHYYKQFMQNSGLVLRVHLNLRLT